MKQYKEDRCKFTKEEVQYGPSKSPAEHRCGICTQLYCDGDHYDCDIVEGPVKLMDGCKKFDMDLIKAANDLITIATNPPKP